MFMDNSTLLYLQSRIKELEDKVEALRVSRRVLMNLVEINERERLEQICRLQSEQQQLIKNNFRYLKIIKRCNMKILELEGQIKSNFSLFT
jgi:hypothetical protein